MSRGWFLVFYGVGACVNLVSGIRWAMAPHTWVSTLLAGAFFGLAWLFGSRGWRTYRERAKEPGAC